MGNFNIAGSDEALTATVSLDTRSGQILFLQGLRTRSLQGRECSFVSVAGVLVSLWARSSAMSSVAKIGVRSQGPSSYIGRLQEKNNPHFSEPQFPFISPGLWKASMFSYLSNLCSKMYFFPSLTQLWLHWPLCCF